MNIINGLKKRFMNSVKYAKSIGVSIGNNCEIYRDVNWGSEPFLITIGDNVRITSGCKFVTHDGGVWVLRHLNNDFKNADLFNPIKVGNNVHIGLNVIIMPGVTIGNNCIIGCGAIVTKSIPDNSIAVGIPARVIETIDEYKNKNIKRIDNTKQLDAKSKKEYLIKKYM